MSLKVLGTLVLKGATKIATLASSISGYLWLWGRNQHGQIGDNSTDNKSSPVQTISGGFNWKKISSKGYFCAGIKTDGTLWTWGDNTYGALGDNSTIDKSSPIQTIAYGDNWKDISSSGGFMGAIKKDGTLWMWGENAFGELGDNTLVKKSSPVQTIAGGSNWKQISVGSFSSAAIKTDNSLWVWGSNSYGVLGDNTTVDKKSPVQTTSYGTDWKQVSCGSYHIAAIKNNGTLWAWGQNTSGQLGDNTTSSRSSPVQTIAMGNTWSQVACGNSHTIAKKTDGSLWLWGNNSYGQLGINSVTNKSSPIQTIAYGTDWQEISAGDLTTGAIKTDGTIWCWGDNTYGQLLDNTTIHKSSPIQIIATGTLWYYISVGADTIAAISGEIVPTPTPTPITLGGGTLWLWGLNSDGQLGDNTVSKKSSPVQTIANGSNWINLSKGFSYRTSAVIKSDGTLWLWGDNDYTQGLLGDNTTIDKSSPVQTITYGTNWKEISCGHTNAVAIKNDGTLWNWGSNQVGQLGDNTSVHKSSPVQTIAGGTNWKQASAGGGQTAAIKNDGTLWLWGYNFFGQLGDRTSVFSRSSPVQTIAYGTDWKQVFCGNYHTAAIKNDGTLWTFGYNNYGQLGDNTTTNKSSPIQTIAGGNTWKYVCAGYSNTLAIKKDGTLWSWGYNVDGQLGDNTVNAKSSPVQTISYGTNWQKVSAGVATAAIKTDGTLWTWGKNIDGALGDNTTTKKSSPVQTIAGGNNWIDVLATESVYGIIENQISGNLWSWGYNYGGSLGDNTTTIRSSPVQVYSNANNWTQISYRSGIKTDGTLWVWGSNAYGDIGDNTTVKNHHQFKQLLVEQIGNK